MPEDLARGRVYLAEEDFRDCGCRSEDLRAGRLGVGFDRLASLNVARAAD
ncbi:MAG: phytoene synthase, partial [Planctomycetia bacterium]